jgi:hypothetical protein
MPGDRIDIAVDRRKIVGCAVGQGSSERVLYNRFLKELEDSGFVQELYGRR